MMRSAHVSRATNYASEGLLLKMCEMLMSISNLSKGHSVHL